MLIARNSPILSRKLRTVHMLGQLGRLVQRPNSAGQLSSPIGQNSLVGQFGRPVWSPCALRGQHLHPTVGSNSKYCVCSELLTFHLKYVVVLHHVASIITMSYNKKENHPTKTFSFNNSDWVV